MIEIPDIAEGNMPRLATYQLSRLHVSRKLRGNETRFVYGLFLIRWTRYITLKPLVNVSYARERNLNLIVVFHTSLSILYFINELDLLKT